MIWGAPMKMVARAWSKWTGYLHTLKDSTLTGKSILGTEDGGVEITTKIHSDGLNGDFRLSISLSADEVDAITKIAATGALKAKIEKLEKRLEAIEQ